MSSYSIVGNWKFKSNRIKREDGSWHSERLYGGMMAFSEKGEACLFVRSDQGSWGYSGHYLFTGTQIKIKIEACIAPDIEGTFLERAVEFVDANELIFSGVESHTGRLFETVFFRA